MRQSYNSKVNSFLCYSSILVCLVCLFVFWVDPGEALRDSGGTFGDSIGGPGELWGGLVIEDHQIFSVSTDRANIRFEQVLSFAISE